MLMTEKNYKKKKQNGSELLLNIILTKNELEKYKIPNQCCKSCSRNSSLVFLTVNFLVVNGCVYMIGYQKESFSWPEDSNLKNNSISHSL